MHRGLFLAVPALFIGSLAFAQSGMRVVEIPTIPGAAVCADEKTRVIERALDASRAASENAQMATRAMVERQTEQAQRRANGDAVTAARAERDRRNDELRRAEAAFDAANRLEERDCRPQSAQAALPAPTPPAGAAPVALGLTLTAPQQCRSGETCTLSVQIENKGSEPAASPLLSALQLGLEGGRIETVLPDTWACSPSGQAMTCASNGMTLQPGETSRFTVEWRLPERVRRPSTSVCARIVWPARGADGVYRPEQIAAMQYALERAGFEPGPPEGRLTPRTLDAMRRFRERAGVPGGTEVTPEFLSSLYGRNASLQGDVDPRDDSACATISFDGAPASSIPSPSAAVPAPAAAVAGAAAGAAAAVAIAPRAQAVDPAVQAERAEARRARAAAEREARQQRQAARREAERRRQAQARRAPRFVDEEVIVVRRNQPRVVYGPGCPCYVFPDGSVLRPNAPPAFFIPRF